jgi:hypothetical protein
MLLQYNNLHLALYIIAKFTSKLPIVPFNIVNWQTLLWTLYQQFSTFAIIYQRLVNLVTLVVIYILVAKTKNSQTLLGIEYFRHKCGRFKIFDSRGFAIIWHKKWGRLKRATSFFIVTTKLKKFQKGTAVFNAWYTKCNLRKIPERSSSTWRIFEQAAVRFLLRYLNGGYGTTVP